MLDHIVTGDETWFHQYKCQSMIWKHIDKPAQKKFKAVKLAGKVMCNVYWDVKGSLYEEYLTDCDKFHITLFFIPTILLNGYV